MNQPTFGGRPALEGETLAQCRLIARQTGALGPCPDCGQNHYRPCDDEAETRAFSEAARACARGEFCGASLESVFTALHALLDDARLLGEPCARIRAAPPS